MFLCLFYNPTSRVLSIGFLKQCIILFYIETENVMFSQFNALTQSKVLLNREQLQYNLNHFESFFSSWISN